MTTPEKGAFNGVRNRRTRDVVENSKAAQALAYSIDQCLLRSNARFDPIFLGLARFKFLLGTCADIGQSPAAFGLACGRDQLGFQPLEVSPGSLFLGEEFSCLDVVEYCKDLSGADAVADFCLHFDDSPARQRAYGAHPAVNGLHGARGAKVLIQLSDFRGLHHHANMFLRGNTHLNKISVLAGIGFQFAFRRPRALAFASC